MFTFEVAELYAELTFRHRNVEPDKHSKLLFNPTEAPAFLNPFLQQLPEPFAEYFIEQTKSLYEKIEEGVLSSIWTKSRIQPDGVRVLTKDLKGEVVETKGNFVAELLRATRNAHHGYMSRKKNQNNPARFLSLTDGNFPAELTSLPQIWYLAFLANPEFVGWRHLPIGHFSE